MRAVAVGWLLLAALVALAGCASDATRLRGIADQGRVVATQINTATRQALMAATDANSLSMQAVRDDLGSAQRIETYEIRTREVREYGDLLARHREHTESLRQTFRALARLAARPGAANTQQALSAVGQLEPPPAENTSLTDLLIGHVQQKALRRIISQHGETINHSLLLQERYINTLEGHIRSDIEAVFVARESLQVAKPFILPGPLPDDWRKNRREVLNVLHECLFHVEQAQQNAMRLRQDWEDFIEGRHEYK